VNSWNIIRKRTILVGVEGFMEMEVYAVDGKSERKDIVCNEKLFNMCGRESA